MTPAQVFDTLTAVEKAKLLAQGCDAVPLEEIERDMAWLAELTGAAPTFMDLTYDAQEAILPGLRRLS